jgi:EAL domain-containing protein (putative c-di-GMP-specific phosphodiesterase class I)
MLKEYNISPNKICFEVTETSSIKDIEQSYKLKYSLKEL